MLLYALHLDIRLIFYLALIPGLLAFLMVLLVQERPAAVTAKSKIDISLRQFPKAYWKYLLVTALFGIGNSSNAFLILRTRDLGASLEDDHPDLRGVQPRGGAHLLPGGFSVGQMGRRNICSWHSVIIFIAVLGFAFTRNIVLIATLFVFYGLYQGIFRSVGKALATDFVPEHCGPAGLAGTTRRWVCSGWWPASSPDAVGPGQPCGGIRLWCSFCCYRQHRLADLAPGGANSAYGIMSAIGTKRT